jgi:hypothetical protein
MDLLVFLGLQPRDILAPSASLLTLLFTVGSFWWTNWRRGHIAVGRPRTYSYAPARDRTLLLLPLPLSNTGAKTIVISALRLREAGHTYRIIPQVRTRTSALPKSEGVDFATAIALEGREATITFAEFESDVSFRLKQGVNSLTIDGWLEHKRKWKKLGVVQVHANLEEHVGQSERLITYDNIEAFRS